MVGKMIWQTFSFTRLFVNVDEDDDDDDDEDDDVTMMRKLMMLLILTLESMFYKI